MASFGLHVESPTVVAAYLNGVFVDRYSVPSLQTGAYIAMATSAALNPALPHVDRVEVRTAPGGTLLLADDFTSLAAWTNGWSPYADWTISPAGFAYNSDYGATIYRAQPSGGDYIEAQGVTFDSTNVGHGWVQLMLYRTDPNADPNSLADDGYRILLIAPGGVPVPGTTYVINGGPLVAGWGVGMVRMGAN